MIQDSVVLLADSGDQNAFCSLSGDLQHRSGAIDADIPPLLPLLLRWAVSPDHPFRVEAIRLIDQLADTAHLARPEFVAPVWAEEWQGAVSRLLGLLDDPDPVVRRAAAFALEHSPVETTSVLLARFRVEPDAAARLNYVTVTGRLLRDTDSEWPADVIDWLSSLPHHEDSTLRYAGVLAARRCGLGGRDPRHVDEAVSYLSTSDFTVWKDIGPGRRSFAVMMAMTEEALGDDRDGRTRLSAALVDHPDPVRRRWTMKAAAGVMNRWRSPVPTLLPHIARRLSDEDSLVRSSAAKILASAGQAAEPWTQDLLAACEDEPEVAQPAHVALARIGAPEAADLMADLLDTPGDLGVARAVSAPISWVIEALLLLPPKTVLPAVRRRLMEAPLLVEQVDYLRVLANWGPAAREALPDIASFLGTRAELHAVKALVALDCDEALELARPTALKYPPVRGAEALLRWRLTGEVDEFLHDPTVVDWELVEARHALWRITGTEENGRSFASAVRRAIDATPVLGNDHIEQISNLVSLGPLAHRAVLALRPLLTTDVRPTTSIPDDDLLCATIRDVVAAAGSVGACHRSPSSTPLN
ncbi:HEAT repeat domain-containing protein [Lentzea sp. JNUCC 0626]|uniref:HEAT repeat domain-containing protein n=1 Tax=Lentzea sp. JNUCC 0626 TaxID=3367513 RepID=UPI00374918E8